MKTLRSLRSALLLILALSLALGSAQASQLFTGSSGYLGASADFDYHDGFLWLTLMNTGSTYHDADVLTGLFFSVSPNVTLTPVGAVASSLVNDRGYAVEDAGRFWAYNAGLGSPLPVGPDRGVAGAVLGIFGSGHTNNGNFGCTACEQLDGVGWGVVNNGAPNGNTTFVESALTFQFGYSGRATFDNVYFQYGTRIEPANYFPADQNGGGEPLPNPTPEPGSAVMLAGGFALLAVGAVRRNRKQR